MAAIAAAKFFRARPRAWLGRAALAFVLAAAPVRALIVATYNIENYLVTDRMVDGVFRHAYPKPEPEKAALVRVVSELNPDILAVQEMGPQPFLDDFQRDLKQAGQDFPYTALLEAADPDRHVAVLAKVPFKEVRRHARVPIAFAGPAEVVKRGVLEVIVATDAGDCSVFVVHLKSRITERADDLQSARQRHAEAVAVHDLVLARYPDPATGRFIVCGDWNDTPDSGPVAALVAHGGRSLGGILPAGDTRGETWTHFYRRAASHSRIDYILVSPALQSRVAGGRAAVADSPAGAEASDHRPVWVSLKLTAGK